jgi:hypothetical protein
VIKKITELQLAFCSAVSINLLIFPVYQRLAEPPATPSSKLFGHPLPMHDLSMVTESSYFTPSTQLGPISYQWQVMEEYALLVRISFEMEISHSSWPMKMVQYCFLD